jgi:Glycosyl hydrolases family 28
MALTPYPSLATLPEVVANGGKIPARTVDAFSTRTVYASSIPGVVLDCDIHAGTKIGGGTPTDNAARINAVLATATPTSPVHLIIDGGCALGAALSIPVTGNVTISGLGWGTGFFWLSGSNCSQIQSASVGTTNLSHGTAIGPTSPQSIVGSNVVLSNFFMNCNRGTYPNGLVPANAYDGTVTSVPTGTTDARGPIDIYWITSVLLIGLDNVHISKLWIYDSPSYHVHLFHCTRVWIDGCRIEAGTPSFSGNTDGIHLNGGCGQVFIHNCWFSTGDDGVAINVDEGDATPGGDFLISDCTFLNCQSVGRIYGQSVATRRVTFSNCQGTGIRAWAFQLGNGSPVGSETNHSVYLRNIDIQVVGPSLGYGASVVYLNASAGLVELENVHLIEPTQTIPLVLYGSAQPTISALRILDCGIHRNASGSSPSTAFACESGGTVGDLTIKDFHLTEQAGQAYGDASPMVDLGHLAVARLSLSGSFQGAGTILNIPTTATVGRVILPDLDHASNAGSPTAHSIVAAGSTVPVSVGRYTAANIATIATGTVTLTGPGLLPGGYAVADVLMGNGSLYLGSDHANAPCVKVGGTAHTINLT